LFLISIAICFKIDLLGYYSIDPFRDNLEFSWIFGVRTLIITPFYCGFLFFIYRIIQEGIMWIELGMKSFLFLLVLWLLYMSSVIIDDIDRVGFSKFFFKAINYDVLLELLHMVFLSFMMMFFLKRPKWTLSKKSSNPQVLDD